MKQITAIAWSLMCAVLTAGISVQLYDRFTGNGEACSFYAPDIDMTCIVGKDEGQKAMYCVKGKQEAAGHEQ